MFRQSSRHRSQKITRINNTSFYARLGTTSQRLTGEVISNVKILDSTDRKSKLEIKNNKGKIALIVFDSYRDNFNKIKIGDKIKFIGNIFVKKDYDNSIYKYRFFAYSFNYIPLTREERKNKINNLLNSTQTSA